MFPNLDAYTAIVNHLQAALEALPHDHDEAAQRLAAAKVEAERLVRDAEAEFAAMDAYLERTQGGRLPDPELAGAA